MESKINYYFKKISEFPYPEIFEVDNVWDVFEKKKEFFKSDAVMIEPSAKIKKGCVLEGPIYIGKNCVIGPDAYIRKGTIIGNDCEIGRMEVKNSIIMNGTKAHHHGYIGDSIIGSDVNIGAGVVLANFKFGGSIIKIGEIVLGRKFGAVLGDNCNIGCNTCTMPATFMGPDVWVYPLCNVNGFVPSDTIIKHKQPHELVDKRK